MATHLHFCLCSHLLFKFFPSASKKTKISHTIKNLCIHYQFFHVPSPVEPPISLQQSRHSTTRPWLVVTANLHVAKVSRPNQKPHVSQLAPAVSLLPLIVPGSSSSSTTPLPPPLLWLVPGVRSDVTKRCLSRGPPQAGDSELTALRTWLFD